MIDRWWDRLCMWLAWHLPRELVKWCCIRVGAEYSRSDKFVKKEAPSMKFMAALEHWK